MFRVETENGLPHAVQDLGISEYYVCYRHHLHIVFTDGSETLVGIPRGGEDWKDWIFAWMLIRGFGLPWPPAGDLP